ncbi:glycerophosphocholine phosphodiesterase GPCPD1-like [Oppia nitens]|uniref:glycerophosphocholine phosphodiesterase GPCPD1-like n=1 Tax=Oppia nitens TaxID=1686743 RepID=UPI0023DC8877|nr:glycerophosphocholine phosphodiesterase GPCPD1-like [Oppia nitens]
MYLKLIIVFLCLDQVFHIECNRQILKDETLVHLKLFDNCLTFYGNLRDAKIRYRLSVLDVNSRTVTDNNVRIFVLDDKDNRFINQDVLGHPYKAKEFVLFSANVTNKVDTSIYVIDFLKSSDNTNWKSFAVSHVLPLTSTDGTVTVPVVQKDNDAVVGSINVNYLVIHPIHGFDAYSDHTVTIKPAAMMGHRGTGVGRRTDLKENILENTIEAFNYACHHKADMIELDIQLTKDKVPIVHHNFDTEVYIQENRGTDLVRQHIAVKDLKLNDTTKISTVESKVYDYADNQPFETLEKVLNNMEPNCGINFEIKYPQINTKGKWDGIKGIELNEYIDIIVKTLYKHLGNRTGIITSFHPDLCAMIHLKQNLLDVSLLTSGDVEHWDPKDIPYWDPRATTIPLGTYFAEGMNLSGLSIQAKDLLADPTLIPFVKSHKRKVYIWGGQLNNLDVINKLKAQGADGLIFDKIDKILAQILDDSD